MKRYRRSILAACCVPWDEELAFAEDIFREQVRLLISIEGSVYLRHGGGRLCGDGAAVRSDHACLSRGDAR